MKNVKDLLLKRDFETIDAMLGRNEIGVRDLVISDNDTIIILAQNLNALVNLNIDELVAEFSSLKDADLICEFAKSATCLNQAHIEKLADYILESENFLKFIEFAKSVPNIFVDSLGRKVLAMKNQLLIRIFIQDVPNIPDSLMDDITKFIVEMNDIDLFWEFLRENQNKELPDSTYKIIAEHLEGRMEFSYILYFLSMGLNIPTESLEILAKPFVKSFNKFEIIKFSSSLKGNDNKKKEILTNAAILTDDPEVMMRFAKEWDDADKTKLVQFLINTRSFKWIYKFAKEVNGIPEEAMKDIVTFVVDTKSLEFVYLFLCNIRLSIPNAEILAEFFAEIKDLNFIPYCLLCLGTKTSDKIERIKSILLSRLIQAGKHNWMLDYNIHKHRELEYNLLNNGGSIVNQFSDIELSRQFQKTMPLPCGEVASKP